MTLAPLRSGKKRPAQAESLEHLAKEKKDKPWHAYRRELNWKDLEPGYAGVLDDDQLAYIQGKLRSDDALSYWWGFRPGQKARSAEAIRRIAMFGSPEVRAENVKLARTRKVQAAA
jgi:hypothetical protein